METHIGQWAQIDSVWAKSDCISLWEATASFPNGYCNNLPLKMFCNTALENYLLYRKAYYVEKAVLWEIPQYSIDETIQLFYASSLQTALEEPMCGLILLWHPCSSLPKGNDTWEVGDMGLFGVYDEIGHVCVLFSWFNMCIRPLESFSLLPFWLVEG